MQNYFFSTLQPFKSIVLKGKNVKEFLQNHITANLNEDKEITPSALCNQKGRVISFFFVKKVDSDCYEILLTNELLDLTFKRLNKTAPFSKVILEKRADIYAIGLCSPSLLASGLHFNYTQNTQILFIDSQEDLLKQKEYLTSLALIEKESFYFYKSLMNEHWFSIHLASSKAFLPNRLGYIKNNTVSVKKGCYIGHEIIARLHFKAKEKHNIFVTDSDLNIEINQAITLNDKEIGVVLDKIGQEPGNVYYGLGIRADCLEDFIKALKH